MKTAGDDPKRGKLNIKGDKFNGNISYTRNVPSFLKQYSHLLTSNKKNYTNESLEYNSQEFTKVQDIISEGAQVVSFEKNYYDDNDDIDQDLEKIKALYNSLDTESSVTRKINKNEEIDKPFNPNDKIIFKKRKISEDTNPVVEKVCNDINNNKIAEENQQKKSIKTLEKKMLSFDDFE
jgi:hypothetical protein